MLHKVLKHMKKTQGKAGNAGPTPYDTSQYMKLQGHSGIRVKKDSTKGASLQRSMGTRDSKSGV